MVEVPINSSGRWLSLGQASRILEVNEGTLRQWADNGRVKVYRTPGGHRRFLREDLAAAVESRSDTSNGVSSGIPPVALEGSALRRIRRGLHQESVSHQPWFQSIEEEGRNRMRLFGRRLLSLLAQDNRGGRRRQQAIDESLMLGREYGSEMRERSVSLKDTVQAFLFFRNMVLDSADSSSSSRILGLADQVLLGVVESYQKRPGFQLPAGSVQPD